MLPLPFVKKSAVVVHTLKDRSKRQLLIYPTSASSMHLIVLRYHYLQQSLAATGTVIRTGDQLLSFFLKNLDLFADGKSL